MITSKLVSASVSVDFTTFFPDAFVTSSDGLVNRPMKADDFQRIEKELQEQMYNDGKKENKVGLWFTQFDNNTQEPVSLESQKTNASEDTFYSFSENDDDLTADLRYNTTNDFPGFKQNLVQRVSEAGIVPVGTSSPGDVLQNGTSYSWGFYTVGVLFWRILLVF